MPNLETIERIFALADKYGSSWAALLIGSGLLVLGGRAATKGAKYVWLKVEPHFEGIFDAHRDLMVTAKDQIPRQTAILEGLAAGQRENTVLLSSIDSRVRTLVAPVPVSGEPCSIPS